jgi:hypothetical protein
MDETHHRTLPLHAQKIIAIAFLATSLMQAAGALTALRSALSSTHNGSISGLPVTIYIWWLLPLIFFAASLWVLAASRDSVRHAIGPAALWGLGATFLYKSINEITSIPIVFAWLSPTNRLTVVMSVSIAIASAVLIRHQTTTASNRAAYERSVQAAIAYLGIGYVVAICIRPLLSVLYLSSTGTNAADLITYGLGFPFVATLGVVIACAAITLVTDLHRLPKQQYVFVAAIGSGLGYTIYEQVNFVLTLIYRARPAFDGLPWYSAPVIALALALGTTWVLARSVVASATPRDASNH